MISPEILRSWAQSWSRSSGIGEARPQRDFCIQDALGPFFSSYIIFQDIVHSCQLFRKNSWSSSSSSRSFLKDAMNGDTHRSKLVFRDRSAIINPRSAIINPLLLFWKCAGRNHRLGCQRDDGNSVYPCCRSNKSICAFPHSWMKSMTLLRNIPGSDNDCCTAWVHQAFGRAVFIMQVLMSWLQPIIQKLFFLHKWMLANNITEVGIALLIKKIFCSAELIQKE